MILKLLPTLILAAVLAVIAPWEPAASQADLPVGSETVSNKMFVEFRARREALNEGVSIGHAFVLVGTEYDNGLLVYELGAGFYPREAGKFGLKKLLGEPGEVGFDYDKDWNYDNAFRVPITEEQARRIRFSVSRWNDNENYHILERNCVDMVQDIARVVGLDTSAAGRAVRPASFVQMLAENNKGFSGIEHQKIADREYHDRIDGVRAAEIALARTWSPSSRNPVGDDRRTNPGAYGSSSPPPPMRTTPPPPPPASPTVIMHPVVPKELKK